MLHAQMYHTKPLDSRELSILGNPYKLEVARKQLLELGIVFYRDEEHSYNALPTDHSPDTDGYYSQLVWNDNTWSIDKWSKESMSKADREFEDSFVWLKYNSPVKIKHMDKHSILAIDR